MQWPRYHVRRGLLRLYLVLAVPWVFIVGYVAYDSNRELHFWQAQSERWLAAIDRAESDPHEAQIERIFKRAGGEDYNSLFEGSISERDKFRRRLDYALIALPAMPFGLPMLWVLFAWVYAGFQKAEGA